MAPLHSRYSAAQRARWLRPDAHRWVRPDAAKFLKPGTDPADVYPALARQRDRARAADDHAFADALNRERAVLDALRGELADVDVELKREALRTKADRAFGAAHDGADGNPGFDDPGDSYDNHDLAYDAPGDRVDAFDRAPSREDQRNGDGTEHRERPYDTRIASNENKPTLGQNGRAAIIAEIGRRLIRVFRSENYLFDLFNQDRGTVSQTEFDGRNIFGSNSISPTYTSQDRADADQMHNPARGT